MAVIVQAVVVGMLVMLAGTLPRNLFFLANLRYYANVPWAVPVTALYLWAFWRYLGGSGPPASTASERRAGLRAHGVEGRVWAWALAAGGLAIAALVVALRLANRLVVLPQQTLPDLAHVPGVTVLSLLLMAAPVAGVVEEAAFRGYMQGPIERRYGLAPAILVTGTMFAVAHLDFTPVLWPYYLAVAGIYGTVTYLSGSILPAVLLHTGGNLYSNADLWLHGQAEWQAGLRTALLWETGADRAFWQGLLTLALLTFASAWAGVRLARAARPSR
jgi:membrane protease YdiL (CAAX protease family)